MNLTFVKYNLSKEIEMYIREYWMFLSLNWVIWKKNVLISFEYYVLGINAKLLIGEGVRHCGPYILCIQ